MKTIISKKPQDSKAIHENLQKEYGIGHPEKTSGYAAFFMNYGDICASDEITGWMDRNPDFREFILSSIREFQNDQYGHISWRDYEENIEDKWISGGYELFGRYAFGRVHESDGLAMPDEYIKIRYYHGNTYILIDSEPDWLILDSVKK